MMQQVSLFYQTFEVGRIKIGAKGDLSFSYSARWLATKGGFPLSVTMPLEEQVYRSEVISPWIANLLPEDRQLRSLARSLGVSAGDAVALLRAIGGDTAGAISFDVASDPEAWHYEPLTSFYEVATEKDALSAHFRDLRQRPFLAGEDGVRLSLAGGQEKTALAVIDAADRPRLGPPGPADRLAVPMRGAPSTIIVKPDNPDLPGIVENEVYCLTLAGLCGIRAAEVTVLESRDRLALCVGRYDRSLTRSGRVRRIRAGQWPATRAEIRARDHSGADAGCPVAQSCARAGTCLRSTTWH